MDAQAEQLKHWTARAHQLEAERAKLKAEVKEQKQILNAAKKCVQEKRTMLSDARHRGEKRSAVRFRRGFFARSNVRHAIFWAGGRRRNPAEFESVEQRSGIGTPREPASPLIGIRRGSRNMNRTRRRWSVKSLSRNFGPGNRRSVCSSLSSTRRRIFLRKCFLRLRNKPTGTGSSVWSMPVRPQVETLQVLEELGCTRAPDSFRASGGEPRNRGEYESSLETRDR